MAEMPGNLGLGPNSRKAKDGNAIAFRHREFGLGRNSKVGTNIRSRIAIDLGRMSIWPN
jgi:hypothetical protein